MPRKSKEIPIAVRELVIEKYKDGVSKKRIAKDLKMGRTTVIDLIKKWETTGSVVNKKGRGAKSRWTQRDTNRLLILIKRKKKDTFNDICKDINLGKARPFSKVTIRRKLRCLGYKRRLVKKSTRIRKINRVKRVRYAKSKSKWGLNEWGKFIFSDESMIVIGKDNKIYVWSKRGEIYGPEHCCPVEKRKISLMVWGSVTLHGVGILTPVKGTITGLKYIDILRGLGEVLKFIFWKTVLLYFWIL